MGLIRKQKRRAELNHFQVLMKTVIDFAALLKCSLKEGNFSSHLRSGEGLEGKSWKAETGVRNSETFCDVTLCI